jgi:phosphate transport system substrate-binding protein
MLKTLNALAIVALLILAACAGAPESTSTGSGGSASIALQGAGATFPYPLYSKWFSDYNKLNPNVKIDYQSIGSGGGIKQITEQTVDFGASDAPMKDDQMKALPKPILHIPTVLGAVVITYNLPSVQGELKLTPEVLTDIFLGKIKKWSDQKIAALNSGLKLPDKDIAAVHRSDGSGTTAIFVDYLSKVSPEWKEKIGSGTSVNWPPIGIGGKGNEGVTGQVKQLEGAVGYVELVYALQNKLPYASIQNQAGKFVAPNLDAVTAAAASSVAEMPEDLRVSITNAAGDGAYPISGYTYLLIYKDMDNQAKGQTLAKFLWWAIHDGQKQAKDLGYAPLPSEVVAKTEEKIKSLTAKGAPALPPQ